MDKERRQKLEAAGIQVDEVMARFMGNEALLERFLGKFPQDPTYGKLCDAIERGDLEAAFFTAHTLKGLSGNLSMLALFQSLEPLVESLRQKNLVQAAVCLETVTREYKLVLQRLE